MSGYWNYLSGGCRRGSSCSFSVAPSPTMRRHLGSTALTLGLLQRFPSREWHRGAVDRVIPPTVYQDCVPTHTFLGRIVFPALGAGDAKMT